VFHDKCLQQWQSTNRICPICRAAFVRRTKLFFGDGEGGVAGGAHEKNGEEEEEDSHDNALRLLVRQQTEQIRAHERARVAIVSELTRCKRDLLEERTTLSKRHDDNAKLLQERITLVRDRKRVQAELDNLSVAHEVLKTRSASSESTLIVENAKLKEDNHRLSLHVVALSAKTKEADKLAERLFAEQQRARELELVLGGGVKRHNIPTEEGDVVDKDLLTRRIAVLQQQSNNKRARGDHHVKNSHIR
jgi:hypothetical protein